MNSCSFSAKFHGLDLLCHFRNPAVLFLHRFLLSNFSFVHLLLQVFQQETLSSSNTDVIFLGSIDIMSEQKGQERASCVSHGSIKRISYLCNAYAAAGCALSSSHPTTRAFRFPCSACAAVGCALPCCIRLPITIAALQCMIFFSIGLLVLIGLCFFYRLETSAPGLSGYYWYQVLGDGNGTRYYFFIYMHSKINVDIYILYIHAFKFTFKLQTTISGDVISCHIFF